MFQRLKMIGIESFLVHGEILEGGVENDRPLGLRLLVEMDMAEAGRGGVPVEPAAILEEPGRNGHSGNQETRAELFGVMELINGVAQS